MRTVLVSRQFVKAPSSCSDVSIIGLMTRQIHAMDTAMPAFPPGDTKLCVNAVLVPGLPPPKVIRNAEASLSAGDVSSMIPMSAFFIRMVEVSLWLTGNGTRGIDLTDCRSRFANSAFSPGRGKPTTLISVSHSFWARLTCAKSSPAVLVLMSTLATTRSAPRVPASPRSM